jgi:hypothetical protein
MSDEECRFCHKPLGDHGTMWVDGEQTEGGICPGPRGFMIAAEEVNR